MAVLNRLTEIAGLQDIKTNDRRTGIDTEYVVEK